MAANTTTKAVADATGNTFALYLVDDGTGKLSPLNTIAVSPGVPVDASNPFPVSGNVVITGNVSITAMPAVTLSGNLAAITGNIGGITSLPAITGTVSVTGNTNVVLQGNAVVQGNVSITAMPAITGSVSLAANAVVQGNVSITAMPAVTLNGTSVISGNVGVTSFPTQGMVSSNTITRPADTTAYAAGDVVGGVITFTGVTAGEAVINTIQFQVRDSAIISGEGAYRLHLYSVTPPSTLTDNAPFDLPVGDRAAYLGYVDLGTPTDFGATCYAEVSQISKQITVAGTSLFGYLQTIGAYTPSASRVYFPTLHLLKV